ncbi:MAG: hypothetical protein MUF79_14645 [Burkholderiales bacterium]|jgi:hypothetical protein|nr:hypothetical protein [Burkholderiales bacterium]
MAAMFQMPIEEAERMRPPLDAGGELALEVYSFMGGWEPDRLPLAVGLFDVEDPESLIERLLVIRAEVSEHQAQELRR